MSLCVLKRIRVNRKNYANYVPMCLKKIRVNRKNYVIYVPMCYK
jgi:hypothetical protein